MRIVQDEQLIDETKDWGGWMATEVTPGEFIQIGDDIVIFVTQIKNKGSRVRLSIRAKKKLKIQKLQSIPVKQGAN